MLRWALLAIGRHSLPLLGLLCFFFSLDVSFQIRDSLSGRRPLSPTAWHLAIQFASLSGSWQSTATIWRPQLIECHCHSKWLNPIASLFGKQCLLLKCVTVLAAGVLSFNVLMNLRGRPRRRRSIPRAVGHPGSPCTWQHQQS